MHQGPNRAPVALLLAVTVAASFFGVASPARAQDTPDTQGTSQMDSASAPSVARISAVDGQVGLKHGDGGSESAAAMNAPMMAGDYLTTSQDGHAEVQLDANTLVRAGADTQLRFTQLDGQADIAQIAQGQVELRVLQDDPDQVQVQTPSVDVQPSQPGAYLISVLNDGNTEVTVRSGSLSVVTPQGTQEVDPGRTMMISGTASNPQYRYEDEVAMTDVEQWGDQRDQALLAEQNQAPPGAPGTDVAGMGDLNADGQWVDIPGYGNAWVPNNEAPSWTPYSDGTWVNEPYYGYTWVAAEPWGWAPYHYGRWAYAAPYGWAWVPGAIYARPVWSPALVAFFGWGGARIGFGFGNVGWVPLAPGEFYHPWWGAGARLAFGFGYANYRNYSHGFIGVSVNTWQHGVISHVHAMSATVVASTHFYSGTVTTRTGFNTQFSSRSLSTNFPRTSVTRFSAISSSYGAVRPATVSAWQHFSTARTNFTAQRTYTPSYARSYPQSTYNRSYPQSTYNRGSYPQSTYNRGSYPQSTYNRGSYPQSTYNRGSYPQSTYNRGTYPSSTQNHGSYPTQRYQPQQSRYQPQQSHYQPQSHSSSRSSAPHPSSSGGHGHGPGGM